MKLLTNLGRLATVPFLLVREQRQLRELSPRPAPGRGMRAWG